MNLIELHESAAAFGVGDFDFGASISSRLDRLVRDLDAGCDIEFRDLRSA